VDFPGVSKKIFAGGLKVAKSHLTHTKTKKIIVFFEKFDGKMSNFKIQGWGLPPPSTPMCTGYKGNTPPCLVQSETAATS